jgi:hypothetical protein
MDTLLTVLLGLLGMGTLRTFEKIKLKWNWRNTLH